jgi:hypothetical protein
MGHLENSVTGERQGHRQSLDQAEAAGIGFAPATAIVARPHPRRRNLEIVTDPVESARAAGLCYVSPEGPGIRRARNGKGFR